MPSDQSEIIQQTVDFVKSALADAEGGHDWWHIERVWKAAVRIAQTENVELYVVELGALLHDIADSKFYAGDEQRGPEIAREFLRSLNVEEPVIDHVDHIVVNISFKGGHHDQEFSSPELDVVQDADRLDALGAIGIARAFNYGGFKNRELYNPNIEPNLRMTPEEYKKSQAPTINHFYEKLLLLKDRMNTETGRELAEHRHHYLEEYLEEFFLEWNGKR